MALATTIDLIQTLIRTNVAAARKVPALSAYPLKADTADLPLILTVPGEAQWHTKGMGGVLKREDRTYRIIAFVEPLGQSELPARMLAAATLLQTVKDLILDTPALSDPTTYGDYQVTLEQSEAQPHADDGITPNQMIGGVNYHGWEMRVRVRELWG